MSSKTKLNEILLVEDDQQLASLLCEYLQLNGFNVQWVHSASSVIEIIRNVPPTLIILDLMLPGMSGVELCKIIRPLYSGRIMMLTASQSELDHIISLESGADDFIVKPIDPRVLLARLRTLLRRSSIGLQDSNDAQPIQISNLSLNPLKRLVFVHEAELNLTAMEFEILMHLVLNAGHVLSREILYRDVMGIEYDGLDRGLDVHISRIRRKLERAGFDPRFLRSVRGIGYLMEMT